MKGKSKCKILKQIRKAIAENNGIAYATSECQFQGECSGTCPKCEAEVRYLEEELAKRRKAGKAVAVAGVAAALVVSSLGCTNAGQPEKTEPLQTVPGSAETSEPTTQDTTEVEWDGELELIGEVPYTETNETTEDTTEPEELVLMGDVPALEDQWEP